MAAHSFNQYCCFVFSLLRNKFSTDKLFKTTQFVESGNKLHGEQFDKIHFSSAVILMIHFCDYSWAFAVNFFWVKFFGIVCFLFDCFVSCMTLIYSIFWICFFIVRKCCLYFTSKLLNNKDKILFQWICVKNILVGFSKCAFSFLLEMRIWNSGRNTKDRVWNSD